jgi:micrococcal nuclease
MLNEELLRQGLAVMHTYPPDVRHADARYLPAQEEARLAGRGIWGLEPAPEGECDAAYPGVCIPPPPPDLDCADIAHRRFTVLPPDPHRFDNDGNGVGCE